MGGRLIVPPEFPERHPEEVVRARIRPLAQDHFQVEPRLLEPAKVELGHAALKSALRIPRGKLEDHVERTAGGPPPPPAQEEERPPPLEGPSLVFDAGGPLRARSRPRPTAGWPRTAGPRGETKSGRCRPATARPAPTDATDNTRRYKTPA